MRDELIATDRGLTGLVAVAGAGQPTAAQRVLAEGGLPVCSLELEAVCEVAAKPGQVALLLDAAQVDAATRRRLTMCLARQPAWADLPIVMLVEADGDFDTDWLGNVLTIAKPASETALLAAASWALRQINKQRQLAHQIDQHQRVQARLRQLTEALQNRLADRAAVAEQRAAQLRSMATDLTRVESRERQRLAQAIHDHLQQLLVASRLGVRVLGKQANDDENRIALRDIETLLEDAIQSSRSLTFELSPPVLSTQGLAAALYWLGVRTQDTHSLPVQVEADPDAQPTETETNILLFDAVRELLFNVVKHAEADQVYVSMSGLDDERIQIEVVDDGTGFDSTVIAQTPHGFGLFNLRQRLEAIGGRLTLDSQPGRGTRARIVAPLDAPVHEQPQAPAPTHATTART